MKLSAIKPNPNNPRLIKDEKFSKLVKSINDFPKMMELRPIIIDDDNVILGRMLKLDPTLEIKRNGEKYIYSCDGAVINAEQS